MHIKMDGGSKKNCLLLFVFFIGFISPVQAADLAYGLLYRITHNDNITRAPSNERSEVINSYLAGISYTEHSSNLIANVLAQVEFLDYRDDIFSDETIYNLKSSLLWSISPQRFTWTVEDTYDQRLVDTTSADTPSNRTDVNVFSTGPNVYIRINPAHTLAFGARVGNVYTERASTDNDRFSGTAGWLYRSTSVSTYSLNYQLLDVNYDDSVLNNDFRRQDVFVRADYQPSRSQYVIDIGVSQIDADRGRDLDGMLAKFSWTRQLTQESSFGASFSREFSDTGTDILATSTKTGLSEAATARFLSNTLTSDIYYARRGSIFYTLNGTDFGAQLSANRQSLDFEMTALDRKETNGLLAINFFHSAAASVTLFSERTKTEYQNFFREDVDNDYGISFGYRANRSVRMALEGRHTDRASTAPLFNFDLNRVLLTIEYRSSSTYTPYSVR